MDAFFLFLYTQFRKYCYALPRLPINFLSKICQFRIVYRGFGSKLMSLRCRSEPDLSKLLPIAGEAVFNSKGKTHDDDCVDDTRIDVLNDINVWADGDAQKCIFWLNGMAGTGVNDFAYCRAQVLRAKEARS